MTVIARQWKNLPNQTTPINKDELGRYEHLHILSSGFSNKADMVAFGEPKYGAELTAITTGADSGIYTWKTSTTGIDIGHATKRWVKIPLSKTPEFFGATGKGIDDDTVALKKWIQWGKDNNAFLWGGPNKKYLVSDTLWFGTVDSSFSHGIRGIDMNGATIIGAVNNKSVCSFAGIANGHRTKIERFVIESAFGFQPRSGMVFARVKQATGEKSSGMAIVSGNYISGHYSVAPLENISSESNVFSNNILFNYSGMALSITRADLYIDTQQITFTGTIGVDEVNNGDDVTMSGGAVVTLLEIRDGIFANGKSGATHNRAWVKVKSGTVNVGDTFAGGAITAVTTKIAAACPELPLGIEATSTSTFCTAKDNWMNNRSDGLMPTMMNDNFNDLIGEGNNFNNAVDGDQEWLLGDNVIAPNAPATGGMAGVKITNSYNHAAHRYSVRIGCPWGTQTSFRDMKLSMLTAGKEVERIHIVKSRNTDIDKWRMFNVDFDVDGTINIGSKVNMRGANKFSIKTVVDGKEFKADGSAGLFLTGELEVTSNVAINDNRAGSWLKIIDIENGNIQERKRDPDKNVTGGKPVISALLNNLKGTDDILNFTVKGNVKRTEFYIKQEPSSGVLTIKHNGAGGWIRTRSGADVVLSTTAYVKVIFDKRDSIYYIDA